MRTVHWPVIVPPPRVAASVLKLCAFCEPNFLVLSLVHEMLLSLIGSSVRDVATVLDCRAACMIVPSTRVSAKHYRDNHRQQVHMLLDSRCAAHTVNVSLK
jgi:hypothetical protein